MSENIQQSLNDIQTKILRLQGNNLIQGQKNRQVLKELHETWRTLVLAQPEDDKETQRWYQHSINDIQKIIGYFHYHVIEKEKNTP